MDPWDTAISNWAAKNWDGRPLICGRGMVAFANTVTAGGCEQELEILGHRRQRRFSCPDCGHFHLWRDPMDHLTVQETRPRALLMFLHRAGTDAVARRSARDAIEWGATSGPKQRQKFNGMLFVLEKYGLIRRDDTSIHIKDPVAIGGLVVKFSERTS